MNIHQKRSIAVLWVGLLAGFPLIAGGASSSALSSLIVVDTRVPVIVVEQPSGTALVDGTSLTQFGNAAVGVVGVTRTYTIRNIGTADLTGIATTVDGVNADDFTVTTVPAATVVPGGSTSFTLKFSPGATGSRSAALHIANSDSIRNPFDIALGGNGTAAAIAVEQPAGTAIANAGSKAYGSVLVGSSKSLTFIIRNGGTANLTGIAITKDGTNAADFAVTTAPAVTVAPGGSTTFALKFTPSATGYRTAAIHIASSDSTRNPFTVTVGGTGIAPAINVEQPAGTVIANAGTKAYGSVLVGSSKSLTFTIRNSGTANLTGIAITKDGTNAADFTVLTVPAVTLVPGGSTNFAVKFTPGATGYRSAAIHIANSDKTKNPFNIIVGGVGTAPNIAVEQPSGTVIANAGTKAYGSVLVGSSKSLTFTIRNKGTASLTGIVVTKDGTNSADFALLTAPAATVAPGGSTTFALKFTPGATGTRSAAIHIANSDKTKNPFNILLSGIGTTPSIAVEQPAGTVIANAGSKAYGSVIVGTSKSLTFTIRNRGSGNLTGIAITKAGTNAADFTVTTTPAATVAPGSSTLFVLKFTPGATGYRSAVIHIANSDKTKNPFNITVGGTGTAPLIAVEQPAGTVIANAVTKAYGSVLVGSSKSLTFTIRNSGTGNLTGIAITKDGVNAADFTVTAAPAVTLVPGGSTMFILKFAPGATGTRTAAIHIANSDKTKNPFNIALSGTGTAPALKNTPGTVVAAALFAPAATPPADICKTMTTVNPEDGLNYLTLVDTKAPGTAGLRRIVEVSPNLVDWYSGNKHTTVLQNDETILKVRDNTPLMPGTKRYIRLKNPGN